jgi:hypothetical protein
MVAAAAALPTSGRWRRSRPPSTGMDLARLPLLAPEGADVWWSPTIRAAVVAGRNQAAFQTRGEPGALSGARPLACARWRGLLALINRDHRAHCFKLPESVSFRDFAKQSLFFSFGRPQSIFADMIRAPRIDLHLDVHESRAHWKGQDCPQENIHRTAQLRHCNVSDAPRDPIQQADRHSARKLAADGGACAACSGASWWPSANIALLPTPSTAARARAANSACGEPIQSHTANF